MQIAADMLEHDCGGAAQMPWLTGARGWHPAEIRYVESWPGRYSTDSARARNCSFASRLLRRRPGLSPQPYPYYHDLWFDHRGDAYSVQFEWALGATHDAVLPTLLDPTFGVDGAIDLCEGQTLEDCCSSNEYIVKVRDRRQTDCTIALRRAVWSKADTDDESRVPMFKERREYRYLLEAKYRY